MYARSIHYNLVRESVRSTNMQSRCENLNTISAILSTHKLKLLNIIILFSNFLKTNINVLGVIVAKVCTLYYNLVVRIDKHAISLRESQYAMRSCLRECLRALRSSSRISIRSAILFARVWVVYILVKRRFDFQLTSFSSSPFYLVI